MVYDDKRFTGSLYVLSEGDYPNLTSMGVPSDFIVSSLKAVPLVRKHLGSKHVENSLVGNLDNDGVPCWWVILWKTVTKLHYYYYYHCSTN